MKRRGWWLAAVLLASAATPASADALDDAQRYLIAGDIDSVLLGLTMGAFAIDATDAQGYTLLHHAAQLGSDAGVTALLDRGADPSIRTRDGKTAAMLAKTPALRDRLAAAKVPTGG